MCQVYHTTVGFLPDIYYRAMDKIGYARVFLKQSRAQGCFHMRGGRVTSGSSSEKHFDFALRLAYGPPDTSSALFFGHINDGVNSSAFKRGVKQYARFWPQNARVCPAVSTKLRKCPI